MADFDEIIASVTTEDMVQVYDGVSIDTMGKNRPDLDNHLMTPAEQKKKLLWVKISVIIRHSSCRR